MALLHNLYGQQLKSGKETAQKPIRGRDLEYTEQIEILNKATRSVNTNLSVR